MAKQILTLVSSLFLISCGGGGRHISLEDNYVGDFSVNEFILRDTTFIKTLSNLPDIIDDTTILGIGEFIGFSNASSSEYLLLACENGGFMHQYNYFYLTDSIPSEYKDKIAILPDTAFCTTLGAYIGISEKEFSDKYKEIDFSISQKSSNKVYEYQDTIGLYQCIYIFNQGYLKHIEFGYVW